MRPATAKLKPFSALVLRLIRAAGQTNRPYERSVCDLNPHGRARAGSSISEYCHSRGVCDEGVGFCAEPFSQSERALSRE
jgi:hypothetical protein